MYAEVFRACAVLTYLAIDDGDKFFDCGYNDHYNHSRGEKRRYSYSGEDSDGKSNDGISLLFLLKQALCYHVLEDLADLTDLRQYVQVYHQAVVWGC